MAFCLIDCCDGKTCSRQDDHGGQHKCGECTLCTPEFENKKTKASSKTFMVLDTNGYGDTDYEFNHNLRLDFKGAQYSLDIINSLGLNVQLNDEG